MTMIGGKPFVQCRRAIIELPAKTTDSAKDKLAERMSEYRNMDEVLAGRSAHERFGDTDTDPSLKIIPEEELLAHASNLQAWVENDYNIDVIDSRIAFPILKELDRIGDKKARNAIVFHVEQRWIEGNNKSRHALYLYVPEHVTRFLMQKMRAFTIKSLTNREAFILIDENSRGRRGSQQFLTKDEKDKLMARMPQIDAIGFIRNDQNLRSGEECPFCGTLNAWEIEFDVKRVTVEMLQLAFDKLDGIIDGFVMENIDVEEIDDDNFYSASGSSSVDDCAKCHATIINFLPYDEDTRAKFKELIPPTEKRSTSTFMEQDEHFRIVTIARYADGFKQHVLAAIKKLKYNTRALFPTSVVEIAFLEFLLDKELGKERSRKFHGQYIHDERKRAESGIKMDNRINTGDAMDDIDIEEISIYVRDDKINYDEIIKEFVEKYHDARIVKKTVKKSARLEKFK